MFNKYTVLERNCFEAWALRQIFNEILTKHLYHLRVFIDEALSQIMISKSSWPRNT